MEAEILSNYPEATVKLIQSSGGVFEVTFDGELIFSKKKIGRHAEAGEVLASIRGKLEQNDS